MSITVCDRTKTRWSLFDLSARVRPYNGSGRPVVAFFVETGAPSRFWLTALPKVLAAGFEPKLITLHSRGPLHDALEREGVLGFTLSCESSRGYVRAAWDLAGLLRRERVNILQSCEPIQATIGGLARIHARSSIHLFHRQHTRAPGRKQHYLSLVGSRLSHYTLACSKSTARWAEDVDGVNPAKTRVALYGVPSHRPVAPCELSDLRIQLGVAPDDPVILLAGYLRHQKGHRVLLEALPAIRTVTSKRPHVIFLGSGPEEATLRELASTEKTVNFVGYQHDISSWFALADVVVMPSLYEPFGLVAVEALAARRPLIASSVEGLMEILENGVSGVLVPPGDPVALAEAVSEVLTSREKAEMLARGGHERFLGHFTVDSMVAGWLACYEEVLQLGGPSIQGEVVL